MVTLKGGKKTTTTATTLQRLLVAIGNHFRYANIMGDC